MNSKEDIEHILQSCLPVLEEKLKDEHLKRVELFKKIIMSEKEEQEFFKSPSKYLKENSLLSINKIKLSEDIDIELIDDEQTISKIRFLREKYKRGELINWNNEFEMGALIVRDGAVYSRRVLWTNTRFWTRTTPVMIANEGVNEIDKLDFGPLISPNSIGKIKKLVEKRLSEEKYE